MKNALTIYRDNKGTWRTKSVDTKSKSKIYNNKNEAVSEARKIASRGVTVIIQGEAGEVEEIFGGGNLVKGAPVRHRMNNRDIDIAIAKVMERG